MVAGELRRHRLGVPAADALAVLTVTGLADVPDGVVAGLRRAPITERVEARVRRDTSGVWRPSTRLERAADAFGDHVRRVVPPGEAAGFGVAESFLRERWAVPGGSVLVRHGIFVAARRPWGAPALVRRTLAATPPARSGAGLAVDPVGLGDEVTFTLGGDGLGMLGAGWSFAEEHGSWTIGAEAVVTVPLGRDVTAGPVVLRLQVVPLLTERVRSRRVDVVVDGELAARWEFTGDGWAEETRDVPVRVGVRRGRALHVRFVVHRPVSPQSLDHDVGTRQLGLSLHSLVIDPAPSRGLVDAAH